MILRNLLGASDPKRSLRPALAALIVARLTEVLVRAQRLHEEGQLVNPLHGAIHPEHVNVNLEGKVILFEADPEQLSEVDRLAYQAPEQVRGLEVDTRADVYALGVLLHELLTGGSPLVHASPAETRRAILLGDIPPLPTTGEGAVPEALAQIATCATATDRDQRFPDAATLLAALEGYLVDDPVLERELRNAVAREMALAPTMFGNQGQITEPEPGTAESSVPAWPPSGERWRARDTSESTAPDLPAPVAGAAEPPDEASWSVAPDPSAEERAPRAEPDDEGEGVVAETAPAPRQRSITGPGWQRVHEREREPAVEPPRRHASGGRSGWRARAEPIVIRPPAPDPRAPRPAMTDPDWKDPADWSTDPVVPKPGGVHRVTGVIQWLLSPRGTLVAAGSALVMVAVTAALVIGFWDRPYPSGLELRRLSAQPAARSADASPALDGAARAAERLSPPARAPDAMADERLPEHRTRWTPGPAPRRAPGFLTVDAEPWAVVYVDGSKIGITPVVRLQLQPGRHQVRLHNPPTRASMDLAVQIMAGRELRRRIVLTP